MTPVIFTIVGVGLLGVLVYALVRLLETRFRYRGKMLVECPETRQAAGVTVNSGSALMRTVLGTSELRLETCTRWPERKNCGQECLSQIEAQPESCLVRNILATWYRDKRCVFCRKPFGEIHWHDHKPALRSPEDQLVEWQDIPVETVPDVLQTHDPVCWNCLIAEGFRRHHPELVTEVGTDKGRPN